MKPFVRVAALAAGAAAAAAAERAVRAGGVFTHPDDAGYAPIDTPKPVGEDAWVVDGAPLETAGLSIPLRMTVLRLGDGSLLLHSPTRLTDALAAELARLGPVRHLVAPNSAHWMFVADWQRRYPDAVTWAAPGLRRRRPVRRSGVRLDHDLDGGVVPPWAGELAHGVIPGLAGFAEVWLFHHISATLVLTDLIQNLEPARISPAGRVLVRLAAADAGTTPRHLRLVVRGGGEAAVRAVERMLALPPRQVVFAHGAWFAADAGPRLRRGLAWLRES